MIKDFETYITEGRMGKLIDAAKKEELRQEDVVRIKTFEDLVDYCKNRYETTTRNDFYIKKYDIGYVGLDFAYYYSASLANDKKINSDILSFKYAGFSADLFMTKYTQKFSDTIDYIFNIIGVDNNIYTVSTFQFGNNSFNYCEISRKDGKNMEPLEALTEIYDKIVSDEENETCIVRIKE